MRDEEGKRVLASLGRNVFLLCAAALVLLLFAEAMAANPRVTGIVLMGVLLMGAAMARGVVFALALAVGIFAAVEGLALFPRAVLPLLVGGALILAFVSYSRRK